MKKFAIAIAAIFLFSGGVAFAGPGDSVSTGDITVDSKNTGTVTSIGGGKVDQKTAGGMEGISGQIGSTEGTETTIGGVEIKAKGKVKTGDITVDSKNTGTVTNIGSKVNEGSVKIE
jgi:hypothetical protein